jgi:hypothetical protein
MLLLGAPPDWARPDLPERVTVDERDVCEPDSPVADVVVAFSRGANEVATGLPLWARTIWPDRMLWVAWPRRAGGHRSDITDQVVREAALQLGLVDTKVAAIDNDWSALRLVWRVEVRRGPRPATLS